MQPDERHLNAIWVLLLCQAIALLIQAIAICVARQGAEGAAGLISVCAYGLAFGSALWSLTRRRLTRALRNTAVVCIGVTTAVLRALPDPLMFTSFDEQLHLRTLNDIALSHRLFNANPGLGVSPRYPGLETVTVLFHQLGLPLMVAAIAVVFVARLALVLVLCDAVEHLTGSVRAGGLAVAVYSMSAHFIAFNTMFSYQTLALPLALAAVSFIARARWAADPRPFFAGATVCLLAVAVTHHLTSWLTVAFLAMWATAEGRGRARRRIFYGAVVAAVATTGWAMIQLEFVRDYFGPMIDDLSSQVNHGHRGAFHDDAGFTTPLWERFFLLYYTASLGLAAAVLILFYARSVGPRRRSGGRRWEPGALLVILAAMVPTLLGARVMPTGSEIADRLGTFLFMALSLLVARASERWLRLRQGSNPTPLSHRRPVIIRSFALVLATGVFVGGYLMGSGPAWIRLPGPYLVAADRRSMDPETLAAVRWAGDELPPGRLIGAERVPSVLLASGAGLFPVMHDRERDVPSMYFADEWGPRQSEFALGLNLRYLFVDRRSANERPHLGSYFYKGEKTGRPEEASEHPALTPAELEKFDNVRGLRTVYRHGPISIYDLGGLYDPSGRDVPENRAGWARPRVPEIAVYLQLAIGLLLGLALALLARSSAGRFVIEKLKSFRTVAGPSLTFGAGIATLCAASTALLLAHVWVGPMVFLAMLLTVLLVNHRWPRLLFWSTYLPMMVAARLRWRKWVAASAIVAVPAALAFGMSIQGAYSEDVTKVESILNDRSAVHIPAYGFNPAGDANGIR